MGKADQSCAQVQSKSHHQAERFCGGRTCRNVVGANSVRPCVQSGVIFRNATARSEG